MSRIVKAYHYSVWMHAVIFISVIVLSRHLDVPMDVLRIDFSLLDVTSIPDSGQRQQSFSVKAHSLSQAAVSRNIGKATTPKVIQTQEKPSVMETATPLDASLEAAMLTPSSSRQTNSKSVSAEEAPGNADKSVQPKSGGSPLKSDLSTRESFRQLYLKEHFEYIRQKIMQHMVYPGFARKMGWAGQVTVAFIIREDGRASDLRIVRTSGFELLDADALDTVRRSSPFPRPPVLAEIVMPITYQLR